MVKIETSSLHTELKNVMERFIQKIKDRTECFIDDHVPCRSESCNRQHVTNWIKMFILYLHMKTDRIKLMKFLTENSEVNRACRFITTSNRKCQRIYQTKRNNKKRRKQPDIKFLLLDIQSLQVDKK